MDHVVFFGSFPPLRRIQRELSLQVGIPGRLLNGGEIEEVKPLEDSAGLSAGQPVSINGKVHIEPTGLEFRRGAMTRNLPKSGLAVIVLGGSHNLGRHLGEHVLYVRVTPKSYPGD